MRLSYSVAATALLLAAASCSPAKPAAAPSPVASASAAPAATPSAAPTVDFGPAVKKPENLADFFGSWKATSAVPGPWYDGTGPKTEPDPEIMGKTVTFTAASASGMREANCTKPAYEVTEVGVDYLFEGGLNDHGLDPLKESQKLGFTSPRLLSMFESCLNSAGDMEMTWNMVDHDTLVLGLNNMVYTFKRVAK